MKKLLKAATPLFAMSLLLAGCQQESDANANETIEAEEVDRITVQATIFPIVDFTERIGGNYVDVTSVFPVGADSHTYEPTQQQMVEIARSDLFIFNGAGMEAFADTVISTLENEDVVKVEASKGISLIEGSCDHDHGHHHDHEDCDHDHSADCDHEHHEDCDHDHSADCDHEHHEDCDHDHSADCDHEHHEDCDHDHSADCDHEHHEDCDHDHSADCDHEHHEDSDHGHNHSHSHGDVDPHIWLDPLRAITMAENILNALVELRPENEEYFQANFEALKADLEELDAAFQEGIANSELDTILVSHAAYGYWTERFGLNQLAVAGVSTTDEPSQQELAEIIQTAREYNIDTILFETTSSPRVAQVVQEELDLNVLYLNHLSTITSEDEEAGRDYFDLMYENLEILKKVLNP